MNYPEAVTLLNSTITPEKTDYMGANTPKDQSWFLERTQRFFHRLGNPEKAFRYVHIAGSSGKGSTAAMCYAVLHHAGKRVGVYMSPYVTTAIENIGIDGKLVDPQLFADAVSRIIPTVETIRTESPEWTPSYADTFFAIAMDCYTHAGVEIIVLETGCGGRFDKTNIIPPPEVAILTPLTFDHTDILGKTIAEIAWHKAGIIKSGSAVVSTVIDPQAQRVFNEQAEKAGVAITYVEPARTYETAMPGPHQQVNAAGVNAAMEAIGIDEESRLAGIADAQLPARVEYMPHVAHTPQVIIDGAHSPGKMEALVETIAPDGVSAWDRIHLVFSAKETKSVKDILSPLLSIIDTATMTSFQLQGFGSYSPQECATELAALKPTLNITVENDPVIAVENLLQSASPNDLILITGSLYLAGILRERWYPEEKIIAQQTAFPI